MAPYDNDNTTLGLPLKTKILPAKISIVVFSISVLIGAGLFVYHTKRHVVPDYSTLHKIPLCFL